MGLDQEAELPGHVARAVEIDDRVRARRNLVDEIGDGVAFDRAGDRGAPPAAHSQSGAPPRRRAGASPRRCARRHPVEHQRNARLRHGGDPRHIRHRRPPGGGSDCGSGAWRGEASAAAGRPAPQVCRTRRGGPRGESDEASSAKALSPPTSPQFGRAATFLLHCTSGISRCGNISYLTDNNISASFSNVARRHETQSHGGWIKESNV